MQTRGNALHSQTQTLVWGGGGLGGAPHWVLIILKRPWGHNVELQCVGVDTWEPKDTPLRSSQEQGAGGSLLQSGPGCPPPAPKCPSSNLVAPLKISLPADLYLE